MLVTYSHTQKLSSFLETMLEEEIVVNGTLTTDGAKIQAIWALRDNFGEAYMREGYSYFVSNIIY